MKVLFLTLLLGLVCAAQEEEAEPSASEIRLNKVSVNQEVMDIFNKLISEKGIKEENVVNFIESEDCPPCALLETKMTSVKESLRPDTPSSPWNQDRQHEDHFPGS